MRRISGNKRDVMAMDPFYRTCARNAFFQDHDCAPDPLTNRLIEWEHALQHGGKQIDEIFAIIPICWWAHRGPGLDKDKNKFIAIMRATPEELEKYPKADWEQLTRFLVVSFYDETHYDLLHGPSGTCTNEECFICAIIDEIV